jgi:DNA-binding MarR family transcriptional regulator/GNAT superfamily N-acetyltransferase
MSAASLDDRIAAVRRFNRFYTQRIGILREGLLDSPFSLAAARVLYELTHRERPTASEISRDLGLDPGYLSRIVQSFQQQGLVARTPSSQDRRAQHLALTQAGRDAFAPLDGASRREIANLLGSLTKSGQRLLVSAMRDIERLLDEAVRQSSQVILRPPRPGEFGWVIARHGAIYADEYGFDARFEALVADIVAAFVRNFDAGRERCWIADVDGEAVGSVFLVRDTGTDAKLRLLLVEPGARGFGVGHRLVAECVGFAREAGYTRITLWTQSMLVAARHIYGAAGFRLVRSEAHHSFGRDLIGEYWDIAL